MNRSNKKLLALTLALSTLAGLPSALAQSAQHDPCIKLRVALDIGSGSTKVRSAIVDACSQTIVSQIAVKKAALGFKDNLSRRESDGGFEKQFIAESVTTITGLVREVKATTADTLKSDSNFADYAYLAGTQPEVVGVATEAFRQSNNRMEFLNQMADQGLLRIRVLPQSEEGHLGFLGAMAVSKEALSAKDLVSWDIGGASLQIVGYQGANNWQDYGNRLASNPMRAYVVSDIQGKEAMTAEGKPVSPNPILADVSGKRALLDKVLAFVATKMSDLTQAGWLAEKLRANSRAQIVGVGGVHGSVLSMFRRTEGHGGATGYSQQDLEGLLDQLLVCSDAEVTARFGVDPKFASAAVTNTLLVYSVMKTLGINQVRVADVDNTLGTMVSFTNIWHPVAGTRAAVINP